LKVILPTYVIIIHFRKMSTCRVCIWWLHFYQLLEWVAKCWE